MIYGGYKENGMKMGADPPIDEGRAVAMRKNTIEKFRSFSPSKSPHLDVGCGMEFSRRYFPSALTTDIDLDVKTFPFPPGYFKTITSFEVLEHLYNPLFHLTEIKRVLAPNGRLYLTTPDDYSIAYRLEHLRGRKYGPHFHQFSGFDLEQIMARAGLAIYSIESMRRGGSGTISRMSRNLFFLVCGKPK